LKIIKKFSLVVLLAAVSTVSSVGQDTHNFTQFYFNPALLNPSYTGSDGKIALYASFRKQWAGIEGSPTIGSFSLQTALQSGVNIGLNASNDRNGLLSTSGALLTGGYTLPITPTNFIRFGISIGAAWNKVDMINLRFGSTVPDAVQSTLLAKNMQVLGNVGLSFHSSTFHGGVSVPNIFQPVYLSAESFSVSKVSPFETVIIHASNRFYFAKDKNVFEPYLIYRYHQNGPAQLEAAAVVHLQNALWLGGSYKQDFGISALAGFKVKGQIAIGYSYSLKNTGQNKISSPSHEINLGVLFGERHKRIPAYSFVNTDKDKKTAKELQASKKQHDIAKQKALDRQRAVDKQKREVIAKKSATAAKKDAVTARNNPTKVENHTGGPRLKQKEDYLTNGNQKDPVKTDPVKTDPVKTDPVNTDPVKTDVVKNDPVKTDAVKTDPIKTDIVKTDPVKTDPIKTDPAKKDPVVLTDQEQHADEQDKIKRLTDHSADPDEHHGLENEEHPHAERHEFVKRGNHIDEMEIGDYIIAGVFRAKENAKHFSDGLAKLGFSISDFGYLTEKNLWYVYLGETDDIDMARRERDKYRKMKMFKDCWLLTVHH
jgi:type IX secretion system PorP/SprF family membrane protein